MGVKREPGLPSLESYVALDGKHAMIDREAERLAEGTAIAKAQRGGEAGVISYLAKLGLGDEDLTTVISLLRPAAATPPAAAREPSAERSLADRPKTATPKDAIKLYVVEEQQILREAYHSCFSAQPSIQVLGASGDTSDESLLLAAATLRPNVMLLGVKTVQAATVEKLGMLRESSPNLALVLLFAFYDLKGIKALREHSRDATVGCAYLLKHTIDTAEQLTQVVYSVAEGRIIVDPMVMDELIKSGDGRSGFLRDLSPRELEVLGWMAKGYRNDTIAQVLSRDIKTVERHINNIYGKLMAGEESDDSRDRRVYAALTYLRATGLLPTEQLITE